MLPLAVVEQHRLVGVSRAARALGVQTGQSSATALALAPALVVQPRDPVREAALVETLALALSALTPRLCLAPSGVLLEVGSTLRLFGGLRALQRRALALAQGCGAQVRLACAPTAAAAWLLATSGSVRRRVLKAASCARRLDALPVAALGALQPWTPAQHALLEALGVQRLGALRALPRAGVQQRFGAAPLCALDRAYGDAPEAHAWFEPPERFMLKRELLQRADDAEVLVAATQALLPALAGWLQRRWQSATVIMLRLGHERSRRDRDRAPDTLLWMQLSTPSRDAAQLALLWRERLQRQVLIAPVYEIELLLEAAVPDGGRPGELLALPGQDEAGRAALLDRLVARLGPQRVQRWQPLADHRPERAQRPRPVHEPVAPAPTGATALPRPAWLLPAPEPLGHDALGRPRHGGGTLRLCSRAERIESGWWDGALVRRDYHVAEGDDHRLRWVYRERQGERPGGWFLHGWFG